ncbi:MAG: ester cyclase [Chloroflexota bacterium]
MTSDMPIEYHSIALECYSIQPPRSAVSTQDNIAATRRIIGAISSGDVAALDELVSADCVEHQRGNNPGREGAKEVSRTLHRWMSDFSLTIEDLVADGDKVWTRNRARGVNTGSVMGNPPTGKAFESDVIDILRFENGQLVEHWGIADQLGLMLQLGIVPGPRRDAAPVG